MDMFQFITNSEGKKKAVIIPIEQYNSLIESQKRLKELEEVDLHKRKKTLLKWVRKNFLQWLIKEEKVKV